MNPRSVDVNVHPAKLEVKFTEEKEVFEALYYTVKTALENHEYRPEISLARTTANDRNPLGAFVAAGEKNNGEQLKINHQSISASFGAPSFSRTPSYREEIEAIPKNERAVSLSSSAKDIFDSKNQASKEQPTERMTPRDSVELLARYRDASASVFQNKENIEIQNSVTKKEAESKVFYNIIGEAFDCYVMVQTENSLLIIDKHAAHERILFEDLKKVQQSDGRISRQNLMLPITVVLTPEEFSALSEYRDQIESVGFDFNLNDGAADLLSVPGNISVSEAEDLFVKMLDELVEGRGNPSVTDAIRKEKALYQIACKAAIKGGRFYDRAIIDWLVGKVLELPDITVCPHGRPIAYRLTKSELDHQFERIK